jgi:hypothetical protein
MTKPAALNSSIKQHNPSLQASRHASLSPFTIFCIFSSPEQLDLIFSIDAFGTGAEGAVDVVKSLAGVEGGEKSEMEGV